MSIDVTPFYCLWIEMSGRVDRETFERMLREQVSPYPKTFRRTVLLDARGAQPIGRLGEVSAVAADLPGLGVLEGAHAAVVTRDERLIDLFVYLARQEGRDYRTFAELEDALAWLRTAERA